MRIGETTCATIGFECFIIQWDSCEICFAIDLSIFNIENKIKSCSETEIVWSWW